MGILCNDRDKELVEMIFGAVGIAKEIKEVLLNAVTGLSGSGPAYVYQFIEALADGGVRSGLPREVAMQLAAQTVKGAAEMVLQTGEHPGALKDIVCSPGGTTIAGVEALEKGWVYFREKVWCNLWFFIGSVFTAQYSNPMISFAFLVEDFVPQPSPP
jgi:pyrroline-5-carboxylate reductase